MQLRGYQKEFVKAIRNEFYRGKRRVLMVLSTGGGKTAIMFDICRRAVQKGGRVLFIVHRRDLAFQTVKKFKEYGLDAGIIMAGVESDLSKNIQVVSVWTYNKRLRLAPKEFNKFYIDATLLVVDEAHRSLSKVFQNVINSYQDKLVVGATATPCLSSGKGMGNMYDALVDIVPITDLVSQNYLVPCIYYGGSAIDTDGLGVVGGDWNVKELGERSNTAKLVGDVVENWLRLAPDRQTIVFAVNRKHARHLCDSFQKAGVTAAYLDSYSSDDRRSDILKKLDEKKVQVIVNVALFQEFLDAPIVSCIVVARSTRSMGLWRQEIGRGLRPYPGKKNCMVIDHGDCVGTLGFIEDDVNWTLDGKQIAWKKPKVQNKEDKPALQCEQCRALFKGLQCPMCGLRVKSYGKKIAIVEAKLQRLDKKKRKKPGPTIQDKEQFLAMAEYHRREKGFKPGWTAWVYKHKFKVFPDRNQNQGVLQPDRVFNNYLTYLRIRSIMGRKKRNIYK